MSIRFLSRDTSYDVERRRVAIATVRVRVLAAMAAVAVSACGGSPITSARIEAALETTFANLAELQASRMKIVMSAPEFAVTAICRNQLTGTEAGSGEWICAIVWQGPTREMLRDTYDLFVGTDGCYTATIGGENLGGPTVKAPDGGYVKNLLYTFEGCFDTT